MLAEVKNAKNIHTFTFEETLPSRESIFKRYDNLKNGPLYDGVNKKWQYAFSEKQIDEFAVKWSDFIYSSHQLEVLINFEKSLTEGLRAYDFLKTQNLLNLEDNWENKTDGSVRDYLYDILIKFEVDPEEGEKSFKHAKTSGNFDETRKGWVSHRYSNECVEYKTSDQLISALLEYQINKENGIEVFKNLKESIHFDKVANIWNPLVQFQEDNNTHRVISGGFQSTNLELIEVLFVTEVNPLKAKQRYQELKESPLYNSDLGHWALGIEFDKTVTVAKVSEIELLSILVELRLNRKLSELSQNLEGHLELPQIRRF